jgi:hypothetical protein
MKECGVNNEKQQLRHAPEKSIEKALIKLQEGTLRMPRDSQAKKDVA